MAMQVINPGNQKSDDLGSLLRAASTAASIIGGIKDRKTRDKLNELKRQDDEKKQKIEISSNFIKLPDDTKHAGIALTDEQKAAVGITEPGKFAPRQDFAARERIDAQREQAAAVRDATAQQRVFSNALQVERDEERRGKIINEGARKMSDSFTKNNIPAIKKQLEAINKAVDIYGDKDIPGVGGLANIAEAGGITGQVAEKFISEEGKNVRRLIAGLKNQVLKFRSGTAVSANEFMRVMDEIGLGILRGDTDLRQGLKSMTELVQAEIKAIESGAADEVLSEYRSRQDAIDSRDPLFDQIPKNEDNQNGQNDAERIAIEELIREQQDAARQQQQQSGG